MKKILFILMAILLLANLILPVAGSAEAALPEANVGEITTDVQTGEPFAWSYLATIAGAAAFTLLIVQFFKAPLDRVWKIPTRVFAYLVSLFIMLVATAFTAGLTVDNVLLVAANAFLAAMSAYGAYEVTFAKIDR